MDDDSHGHDEPSRVEKLAAAIGLHKFAGGLDSGQLFRTLAPFPMRFLAMVFFPVFSLGFALQFFKVLAKESVSDDAGLIMLALFIAFVIFELGVLCAGLHTWTRAKKVASEKEAGLFDLAFLQTRYAGEIVGILVAFAGVALGTAVFVAGLVVASPLEKVLHNSLDFEEILETIIDNRVLVERVIGLLLAIGGIIAGYVVIHLSHMSAELLELLQKFLRLRVSLVRPVAPAAEESALAPATSAPK